MVWQSQDFQGILSLDRKVVEQLTDFLIIKESHLSNQILMAIHPFQDVSLPPVLHPVPDMHLHLNESIEELNKKITRLEASKQSVLNSDWKIAANQINQALWEYTEILESCVIELYQQLDQIGFEFWDLDLFHTVSSIKDLLSHHIEELMWTNKRLEHALQKYRKICQRDEWNLFNWPIIDKVLNSNLLKSQKFLGFEFQKFNDSYKGYIQLYADAQKELQQFFNCRILTSLDIDFQERIKKIYFLLRIWKFNHSARTLAREDTIRAIRREMGPEEAKILFEEYYKAIRRVIFDKSRMLKSSLPHIFEKREGKVIIKSVLDDYRHEIGILIDLVSNYDHFLSETDPKTHAHVHWHPFRESPQAQQLYLLRKEIEKLDLLCEKFQVSLDQEVKDQEQNFVQSSKEIQRLLHEMGQPLMSQSIMRSKAQAILNLVNGIDELGSSNPKIVSYVCEVLSRAMHVDWKYQVFHEFPEFHEIFEIHQGIVGPIEERQHWNRLNKFKKLIGQLKSWVQHGDTLKHLREMELDLNDIKGYLQDFLGYVQRMSREEIKDKEGASTLLLQMNQKLLEYRYLFSHFFHDLHETDLEEKMLRKQLLFVDQYFENIDTRLQEMKTVYQSEYL